VYQTNGVLFSLEKKGVSFVGIICLKLLFTCTPPTSIFVSPFLLKKYKAQILTATIAKTIL